MPTDQEVPLFDIRQHMSADQWSHDYLSPASNGKKDQMFGCSVGRRIYQAKMHGIKTLSGNYGGNPLIGKMISLPVSFLTNYGVEHLRHPEENERQHLGRAGVRVGFEQILGSFIPAYKTVSTIAEVANYSWEKLDAAKEKHKYDNILLYGADFHNQATGHLTGWSNKQKEAYKLIHFSDLGEGYNEAMEAWEGWSNFHKIKGVVVESLGDNLVAPQNLWEKLGAAEQKYKYDNIVLHDTDFHNQATGHLTEWSNEQKEAYKLVHFSDLGEGYNEAMEAWEGWVKFAGGLFGGSQHEVPAVAEEKPIADEIPSTVESNYEPYLASRLPTDVPDFLGRRLQVMIPQRFPDMETLEAVFIKPIADSSVAGRVEEVAKYVQIVAPAAGVGAGVVIAGALTWTTFGVGTGIFAATKIVGHFIGKKYKSIFNRVEDGRRDANRGIDAANELLAEMNEIRRNIDHEVADKQNGEIDLSKLEQLTDRMDGVLSKPTDFFDKIKGYITSISNKKYHPKCYDLTKGKQLEANKDFDNQIESLEKIIRVMKENFSCFEQYKINVVGNVDFLTVERARDFLKNSNPQACLNVLSQKNPLDESVSELRFLAHYALGQNKEAEKFFNLMPADQQREVKCDLLKSQSTSESGMDNSAISADLKEIIPVRIREFNDSFDQLIKVNKFAQAEQLSDSFFNKYANIPEINNQRSYFELLTKDNKIQYLLDSASESAKKGDIPSAIKLYQQVQAISPDHLKTAVFLSDLYLKQGDFTSAIKEVEKFADSESMFADQLAYLKQLQADAVVEDQAKKPVESTDASAKSSIKKEPVGTASVKKEPEKMKVAEYCQTENTKKAGGVLQPEGLLGQGIGQKTEGSKFGPASELDCERALLNRQSARRRNRNASRAKQSVLQADHVDGKPSTTNKKPLKPVSQHDDGYQSSQGDGGYESADSSDSGQKPIPPSNSGQHGSVDTSAGHSSSPTDGHSSEKDHQESSDRKITEIERLSQRLSVLLADPNSSQEDFIKHFQSVNLEHLMREGCFAEFHKKFMQYFLSGELSPQYAKKYRSDLDDIIKNNIKHFSGAEGAENVGSKHLFVAIEALKVLSNSEGPLPFFGRAKLASYASSLDLNLKNQKFSELEDIKKFQEQIGNISEFNANWVRHDCQIRMQYAEITQYILDKVLSNALSEELYLAADSVVEVWSRYYELFSEVDLKNEFAWNSLKDAGGVIIPGLLMLYRNHVRYQLLTADQSSKLDRYFDMIMADSAVLGANVAVSSEFFFPGFAGSIRAVGKGAVNYLKPETFAVQEAATKTLGAVAANSAASSSVGYFARLSTGLLYFSYYAAQIGKMFAYYYQQQNLKTTGRYDESKTTAVLTGMAHGIANNPLLGRRVAFSALTTVATRVDKVFFNGYVAEKFVEKMVTAGILEKTVEGTVLLSTVASSALLMANVASAALLVHDAYQYATLIYGDTKLNNLFLELKEAQDLEMQAYQYFEATKDEKKFDQMIARARLAYKDVEVKFADSDYKNFSDSEQLHLKQELGRLNAALGADPESAPKVFADALNLLKDDEMFNREKDWRSWFVNKLHNVYRESDDSQSWYDYFSGKPAQKVNQALQYLSIAKRAFLATHCDLSDECDNNLRSFIKETDELQWNDDERSNLDAMVDQMREHAIAGRIRHFETKVPRGVFDDASSAYQQATDYVDKATFHDPKAEAKKSVYKVQLDLLYGRFPWTNDPSSQNSLSAFVRDRFSSKLFSYLSGGDAGIHEKNKKYDKSGLSPSFEYKEHRANLFLYDMSLRVISLFAQGFFSLLGRDRSYKFSNMFNALMAIVREWVLGSVSSAISNIKNYKNRELTEWQCTRQNLSFMSRLLLPLISLVIMWLKSRVWKAIFMAIQLFINVGSFASYAVDIFSMGLNLGISPLANFLGVIFTAFMIASQLKSLLHSGNEVNKLVNRIEGNHQGNPQLGAPNFVDKMLTYFSNCSFFQITSAASMFYFLSTSYPDLSEILRTYGVLQDSVQWTWALILPFTELMSYLSSTFELMTVTQSINLAAVLIGLYLIIAGYNIARGNVGDPSYVSRWMSNLTAIVGFNLFSHFSAKHSMPIDPPQNALSEERTIAPDSEGIVQPNAANSTEPGRDHPRSEPPIQNGTYTARGASSPMHYHQAPELPDLSVADIQPPAAANMREMQGLTHAQLSVLPSQMRSLVL